MADLLKKRRNPVQVAGTIEDTQIAAAVTSTDEENVTPITRSNPQIASAGTNIPIEDEWDQDYISFKRKNILEKTITTIRVSKETNIKLNSFVAALGYNSTDDYLAVLLEKEVGKLNELDTAFYKREYDKRAKIERKKIRDKKEKEENK